MLSTVFSKISKDAKLGKKGQVVIPAEFREVLGLKPGDSVILILENGAVRLMTRDAITRELSGAFALANGRSLGAELGEERRAEAAQKWS
jgi:AbrB family looped-hinge helix DNA binding protein